MKLKSVSGFVCYVKNLDKTAEFYEKLGFLKSSQDQDRLSLRLNWFWIDFHPQDKEDIPEFQKKAKLEPKGAGIFIYCSVENVDEYYQFIIGKGLKPASEPKDYPWGNREFMIHDPDGYKLVFFKRK